jgi:hypothetical protein
MLQHTVLVSAIREPFERARRLRALHGARDALLIEETLLQSFSPLIGALSSDVASGRALCSLFDLITPLPLDALAWDDYPLVTVRLSGAVMVPDLVTLDSLEQIRQAIDAAIAIGAPTYNNGDARACATLYWVTALTLTQAPTARGFAGQMRALKPLRQAVEEPLPFIGRDVQGINDFAWRMRQALDAARGLTR